MTPNDSPAAKCENCKAVFSVAIGSQECPECEGRLATPPPPQADYGAQWDAMSDERKPSADDVLRLMAEYTKCLELHTKMHKIDGQLLELIRSIMDEHRRLSMERGFWWHIKAAFVSLIYRLQ